MTTSMEIGDAMESFNEGTKNLLGAIAPLVLCRDMLGQLLATLTIPANRDVILGGDREAIAKLYVYIDGVRNEFEEANHAPVHPLVAAQASAAPRSPGG